ncbi:MAG: putative 2OG-Fe(II) oxygenase [Polyangiaceae bacterium]|nr:putative 2OG-Fe(II) oxygenase [Polyangiaceae bacterium]
MSQRGSRKLARKAKRGSADPSGVRDLAAARAAVRKGRLAEAVGAFEAALEAHSNLHAVRHEAALLWARLGHWPRALHHFETLIASGQASVALISDWGSALAQLGRTTEAGAAFARAVAEPNTTATAHAHLAHWLSDQGEISQASQHYDEALALEPNNAAALLGRGELRQQLGEPLLALSDFECALRTESRGHQAFLHVVEALLALGRREEALAHAERLLQARPGDCGALAVLALLLRECGNEARASLLNDLDGLVFQHWLDPPPLAESLEDFVAQAAHHVVTHPSLIRAPLHHATVSGGHTGELLIEPKGPIAEIERQLEARLLDVWRALPDDSRHPWLLARPAQVTVNAWGVVLEEGGHQIPHIHPEAWLSGVMYLALPEGHETWNAEKRSEGDSEAAQAGWLEFGKVDPRLKCAAQPSTRSIRPELGKIVFFPSFFYHRTLPFRGPGKRVSLAFDVIPVFS